MEKPLVFYVIAAGGYLTAPIFEKREITPDELDDNREDGESDAEVLKYLLDEEAAELEQKFATVLILNASEWDALTGFVKKVELERQIAWINSKYRPI